ncbi:MAG: hypothetical protein QE285_08010 [Aquabacterium sp.]|nr:hypothetical protein [Aquabacterium sp.]
MQTTTALSALRALCQPGLSADVLVPAVLEALHGLVPSARNLFDWTDDQGRLLRYYIEGPIDAQLAQLYFDEFHNSREAEAMPPFHALRDRPAGVCGADDLDAAGFHRSALYHEIWKPQGFHTRLEAVLRGCQGRLLGSLVLYRGPHDAAFTPADRHRLACALPLLAQALEDTAATSQPAAAAPDVPAPEPAETLLLTLDGQARHASPGALRLLLMAGGGASREALSRPLHDLGGPLVPAVLARLRLAPNEPAVVSHASSAGRFVASGRMLQPVASGRMLQPVAGQAALAAGPPLVQLSLRRHEPHRVALERALRHLPITPGQIAVCRALYQGQPQARIGQALGVAPSTVVDHVRKAYRALDLHSVLDLRALLDKRIASALV